MAADVVEAIEIHDMDRIARRAEALRQVEHPITLWRAVPEPDRVNDVEFRPWGRQAITAQIFAEPRRIACARTDQPPCGPDRETAPAELIPPLPGFSPKPDRGSRAPQPGTNAPLRGDDHASRLAWAQHASSGSARPVTGSASGNGTVAIWPTASSCARASARRISGLCPRG